MSPKEKANRQKRAPEIFDVKQNEPHTYRVASQSELEWHPLTHLNGNPSCSCKDWSHITACEMIPYQDAEGAGLICRECHRVLLAQAQEAGQQELAPQLHELGFSGATSALVQLALYIRMEDENWFPKGPQLGESQTPDPADALKGAVTDASKKAPAWGSIGNKAHRGELVKK